MLAQFDARRIVAFHDAALADGAWPERATDPLVLGPWCWVHANHRYNTLAWHERYRALNHGEGAAGIALSKRLLERHRQRRDDAVSALDEAVFAAFSEVDLAQSARLCSETPGTMVDRLSMLALRIALADRQAQRRSADETDAARCTSRLVRLKAQRNELGGRLDQFLKEAAWGRAFFALNPRCRPDGAPGGLQA